VKARDKRAAPLHVFSSFEDGVKSVFTSGLLSLEWERALRECAKCSLHRIVVVLRVQSRTKANWPVIVRVAFGGPCTRWYLIHPTRSLGRVQSSIKYGRCFPNASAH
jgi:hypothetical protein